MSKPKLGTVVFYTDTEGIVAPAMVTAIEKSKVLGGYPKCEGDEAHLAVFSVTGLVLAHKVPFGSGPHSWAATEPAAKKAAPAAEATSPDEGKPASAERAKPVAKD